MLPIPEGSWITGEYIQDWSSIKDGTACIILTLNEGIVFKIIENTLKTKNALTVHSLNPLYEKYLIHIDEIKEIWKFRHFISEELPEPEIPKDEILRKISGLQKEIALLKKG